MPNTKRISLKQWALDCQITVQAARKRVQTLGIPVIDGTVDPAEANRIVVEQIDSRKQRPKAGAVPAEGLNEARLRRESAKADCARIEADLLMKSVISKQEVMRLWGALIIPAKTRLLAMGAKLAPALAIEHEAAECQKLVNAAVHEALTEISNIQWIDSQ